MGAPLVLLVDDSDAVLAYERAALSGHYTLRTASDGASALEAMAALRPAIVLLDLSMPVMDGDAVLARMKADPALARIPVVIVSSEHARGAACVRAGAAAFAPKPVSAAALLALVNRVYDEAISAAQKERLGVLFVGAGRLEVGLPIECVRRVFEQPATVPLPGAPSYANAVVELHDEGVCVLDLAARLDEPHVSSVVDRRIIVLQGGNAALGLCVDEVHDPEDFALADLAPAERWDGPLPPALGAAMRSVIGTARGPRPLIEPKALFPPELLEALSHRVRTALARTGDRT